MKHQHYCFSQLITETAHHFHQIRGMVNIQVVSGFVQQNIFCILSNYHGNIGSLALASGQLIYEPLPEGLQFHIGNRPVNYPFILIRQTASGIGKTPKCHQLFYGKFHLDLVALGQDCKPSGQLPAPPAFDILPLKLDQPAVSLKQS